MASKTFSLLTQVEGHNMSAELPQACFSLNPQTGGAVRILITDVDGDIKDAELVIEFDPRTKAWGCRVAV